MAPILQLFERKAYPKLVEDAATMRSIPIESLFVDQPDRSTTYSASAAGLTLDFSRQAVTDDILTHLVALATEAQLRDAFAALRQGSTVNATENRPALHTLLRSNSAPEGLPNEYAAVAETRRRMQDWSEHIRSGRHTGFSGQPITDVVNLGIGGSDLGPRLVNDALQVFDGKIDAHFVANVDPAALQDALLGLSPESTLFVVCSKSFGTEETITNARAARSWLLQAGAEASALGAHFLAITTDIQAAADMGIPEDHCLPLWDWVGGRYSLWSAIGLSCAISLGWHTFSELLAGAQQMDEHVEAAVPGQNLAVLMALLEVWNTNFLGADSHVVLPYCEGLGYLPEFLQQLTMESNGKRVDVLGRELKSDSAPMLWGAAGTMGQHSFHQLLHQGTRTFSADFILPLTTHTGMTEQHGRLVANCLAQSRAMTVGRTEQQCIDSLLARGAGEERAQALATHLAIPGNRPHSLITMDALTPRSLGALLALYEHRTYFSSLLWGINAFDQWGVELGKDISGSIYEVMQNTRPSVDLDTVTLKHIAAWRAANDRAKQQD
ncbi:glucose-6-phosphate isomerase [Parahalioglobus pacificus]|uniref:Glucose-6-phosphate isomerase n=1 Tax=Parahalioglobus pacificus TaxID=930806 RepID=A0A918XM39_9GAMM|nr:glucose-6-phosphate isomerase [Halioglobus pacificus]GHD38519.1 glucose-6-phosphate isomerase [Halioglobus pacificus]